LIRLFAKQLPAITETQRLDVERLADLTVLAENKRAAMLAGEPIEVFDIARLENTINRVSWMLGLGKRRRQDLEPTEEPLAYAKRVRQEEAAGA
jgi:hypothetical protein